MTTPIRKHSTPTISSALIQTSYIWRTTALKRKRRGCTQASRKTTMISPKNSHMSLIWRETWISKWPALDKMEMLDRPIDDESYDHQIKNLQRKLLDLQIHYLRTGGRVLIGFDGWDAAGKGGLIQRMVYGLEPRSTHVWRIGAPTKEEQGRHYLWRF